MKSSGSDPELLLLRQTVVSLAVQALIDRLVFSGALAPADLLELREVGLQLADGLQEQAGSHQQVSGARLDTEIRAWWAAIGLPAGTPRPANNL